MARKKVALCDGHGMLEGHETPGKRTPIFPAGSGMKSETGNFMYENEFNRAVVKYIDAHLKRCGIDTVLTAPTDADTPLAARVKKANDENVDLYFSVHANANTSKWGTWGGIETYYGSSETSKKYAAIAQKYLLQGTKLRDRGIKDGSWLYLNRVKSALVLIEAAFMDNLEEAKLLLSDAYRQETALESAKAICEMLGVAFVPASTTSKTPSNNTSTSKPANKMIRVIYEGKEGLAVRENPNFDEKPIGHVKKGDAFTVVGELDNFYKLKSGLYITKHPKYVQVI